MRIIGEQDPVKFYPSLLLAVTFGHLLHKHFLFMLVKALGIFQWISRLASLGSSNMTCNCLFRLEDLKTPRAMGFKSVHSAKVLSTMIISAPYFP
jgi:hypothetical protein